MPTCEATRFTLVKGKFVQSSKSLKILWTWLQVDYCFYHFCLSDVIELDLFVLFQCQIFSWKFQEQDRLCFPKFFSNSMNQKLISSRILLLPIRQFQNTAKENTLSLSSSITFFCAWHTHTHARTHAPTHPHSTLPGSWYTEYLEDVIVRLWRKVWRQR